MTTRNRFVAILTLVCAFLTPAISLSGISPTVTGQQASSAEQATIRGQVRAADSGGPAVDVEILLDDLTNPRRFAKTDTEGRYEFAGVRVGRYLLKASKAEYLTMNYGQSRWFDTAYLDVNSGQTLEADFLLRKAATILAHVTDDAGKPLPNARVEVFHASYSDDGRRLVSASTFSLTDNRGELRIMNLPPGDHFLRVTPPRPAGSNTTFQPSFYRDTLIDSEAEAISVTFGQEVSVSISLPAKVPLARVSGRLLALDGAASSVDDLILLNLTAGSFRYVSPEAGAFAVDALPAGDYYLFSKVHRISGKPQHFAARFSLGANNLTDLTVKASEPATVVGQLVFDPDVRPSTESGPLELVALDVDRLDTSTHNLRGVGNLFDRTEWTLNNDGTFRIASIQGGRRIFRPNVSTSRWLVKAVTLDGKDITDTPIDFDTVKNVRGLQIVVTQRRTTVSGSVTDSAGARVKEFAAIIFSASPERWTSPSRFIATYNADAKGEFMITGLPAGAYLAAAIDSLQPGAEFDPQLLSRLRDRAAPLTLDEGESKTVVLNLVER